MLKDKPLKTKTTTKKTVVGKASTATKAVKSKPVVKKAVAKKVVTKPKKVLVAEDSSAINIVEAFNRGVLHEGRNSGMAFGFLQKKENGEYHTTQPLSPCKDYLHEPIITEWHGIPTQAHGLNYSKKFGIFENTDIAYMAIKIMKTHSKSGGGTYSVSDSFDKDKERLKTNYKNVEYLINQLEELINVDGRTKVEPANDDYFLVTIPIAWCKSTAAISLYTLIMRNGIFYDGQVDAMTFLKVHKGGVDSSFLKNANPKIELCIKEKKLPPNHVPYSKKALQDGYQSPHNNGIVNWNSKFDEVELKP